MSRFADQRFAQRGACKSWLQRSVPGQSPSVLHRWATQLPAEHSSPVAHSMLTSHEATH